MPTAEGVFTKIGNDPIYASEVNKFGRGNTYFLGGSNFIWVGSTAAGSDVGSFVIGAGSLSDPCIIEIRGITSKIGANPTNDSFGYISISGAEDSGQLRHLSLGDAQWFGMYATGILGSPGYINSYYGNTSTAATSDVRVNTKIFNIFPNSGLVIHFGIKHNAGNSLGS